jgi:hypothetical protein
MSRSSLIVFYGPRQVTDGGVLDKIAEAIDQHKNYPVSNQSMGGDPAVGTFKYAAVYYSLRPQNSPLRGRSAGEGQSLSFGTDIDSITYGGVTISNPSVYVPAYNNFLSKSPFPVNNNSMGGDPRPGTHKTATAIYYRDEQSAVEEARSEGDSFKWDAHN